MTVRLREQYQSISVMSCESPMIMCDSRWQFDPVNLVYLFLYCRFLSNSLICILTLLDFVCIALYSLHCLDVSLRNCSLTQSVCSGVCLSETGVDIYIYICRL